MANPIAELERMLAATTPSRPASGEVDDLDEFAWLLELAEFEAQMKKEIRDASRSSCSCGRHG